MDNYVLQTINVCRQTWYNLYGEFPKTKNMIEMLGREYRELGGCSTAEKRRS